MLLELYLIVLRVIAVSAAFIVAAPVSLIVIFHELLASFVV